MKKLFSKPNYRLPIEQQKLSTNKQMELTASTWEKDSHGLFDYQATKLSNKKFKIEGKCKIFRNWLTAETLLVSNEDAKKGKIPNHVFNFLASIGTVQNGIQQSYYIHAPERTTNPVYREGTLANDHQGQQHIGPLNTNSYLVIRSFKTKNDKIKGYPLSPGNIIKLGRMEYLVIQCQSRQKKECIKGSAYLIENSRYEAKENLFGTCKICLEDDTSESNFLLSPCNCKGSCQLIHLQCLKRWINNKVKKQTQGVAVTYSFSKFQCELCKQPFPKLILRNNQEYQMLQLQKPEKPYIMFQSMNQEKSLYLITADENVPIKLGRGHQCQIRMTDISVSRIHSQIKLIEDKFYISDNNSKFGTLIKITQDLKIQDNLQIQCGRSLYTFNESSVGPKSSAYLSGHL